MSVYDTPAPGAFGANGYADASLAANTAYKNTLARINQKRSGTLRQYGYLGDINPDNGVLSNVRVDPNNAYGGLQSMLRGQAGDFEHAAFQAQERGLHGGLAHKQDADLAYQHGGQAAQLGAGFTDTLGGFQDDQNTAAYDRNKALYEAELAATRSAVDDGDFNPGDYSGLDYAPYGADPIPTQAQTLAAKVISNATKKAVATSKVAKASSAAKAVAAKAGQSSAAQALAARSAGLNAKYGLPKKKGGK
jgi:hypothetical protein